MIRSTRLVSAVLLLLSVAPLRLPAEKKKKSPDEGMVLPPVVPDKKKKKGEEITQPPPPSTELPAAVLADTDRLTFQVAPLSAKGLLSQQTRDAVKALLRTSHGSTILKLRAFVAGSGDLRRVGEIVGELFTEKHLPLPVLTVVQAGALPLEGAQVAIESIAADKRNVNPNGIAFISGQGAPSAAEALNRLRTALRESGAEPAEALQVTCFVSLLEAQSDIGGLLTGSFPGAAVNYVQRQREADTPACECEAVARLAGPPPAGNRFLSPASLPPYSGASQIVAVTSPQIVISGTQLAFGSGENDIRLAFERLRRALAALHADFGQVVMSDLYVTSRSMLNAARSVRGEFYNAKRPPAGALLMFEGLPSLDSSLALDVIAVP